MELSATISPKDIDRIMTKLKKVNPKDRASLTHKSFVQAELMVERSLKQNISGKFLKVQTGRLMNSVESSVRGTSDGIEAVIGSGARSGKRLPYANIHENGGKITPKKSKYLTIPIADNRRPDGLSRFSASELISRFKTFNLPSAKGKVLMAIMEGKAKPMFALVEEVTIPASHYLSKTLAMNTKKIMTTMLQSINRGLQR